MLFNNKFYNIEQSTISVENASFSIRLNKSHSIYNGHFPDFPVTPGVVQLEIIKELISISTEKNVSLLSIRNCKFLAVLVTDDSLLSVDVDFTKNEDGELKISARIFNPDNVFLKLNGVYLPSN